MHVLNAFKSAYESVQGLDRKTWNSVYLDASESAT